MKVNSRLLSIFLFAGFFLMSSASLFASCSAPANKIEAENCLAGSPSSEWDITGSGDPTIQGYAAEISVNVGSTVQFKVNTTASAYHLDIYRMGYYGGNGARLVATINPSAQLPQVQPSCISDSTTGLVDCGNWAVSASWQVPANATSGIYFAHLVRNDTGGDSHIIFIVRDDSSHSAILFQTADESWVAYNGYGGHSVYGPDGSFDPNNRASKVSYNRPFDTRSFGQESATWVFGAEYPMVRFLEANGYDVSYFTGIDAARYGTLIQNHKLYMDSGHDEYWSLAHRNNVEAARDAGVNLAFFAGNEVFWKTRLENSIDGTNEPNKTIACYKDTLNTTPQDPMYPSSWTGTWRDARFSPPADGGRPENALTGTLFTVNGPGSDNNGTLAIQVPAADGKMRFWRNTSIATLASGTTATLPMGTLAYEWDEDIDNGFRPAGNIHLSTTVHKLTTDYLLDQGATYGAGTATHSLTLHRASSGALVFGSGTVQWSWGLDDQHDNPFFSPNAPANTAMKQATVNLFADMGVQPATLQSGLVAATASTDTTPPTSTVTWPVAGSTFSTGTTVSITGTASDVGGNVGGVEVSTDSGQTWHPAVGRESWSYSWRPSSLGQYTIMSRATDDSLNTELTSGQTSVITVNPPDCPCSATSATPTTPDGGDATAGEYGVRFRADFDGYITGIRFYKATTNTGTHLGHLWSNTGTLLASAIFTSETASGWQSVKFSNPVPITANTTYVASYYAPVGHYTATAAFFATSGLDSPPIHLLQDGIDGANGIYAYGSTGFPTSTFRSGYYWVDVTYLPAGSMPGAPPSILVNPTSLNFAAVTNGAQPASQSFSVYNQGADVLTWTAASNASWLSVTPSGTTPASIVASVNTTGLNPGTYTATITVTASGALNPPQTVSVTLNIKNLLLSSNFNDGTMQGWALSPGTSPAGWSVRNSALQYGGIGDSLAFAGNSNWADYTFTADFKLSSMNNWPGGIRGRVNPSTGAGYAAWIYPQQGLLILYRTGAWDINQGLLQLGSSSVALDAVNSHNIGLSFTGSQIKVSLDGATVITATDATYATGMVAFEGDSQPITFDNALVTSLSSNTGSLSLSPNTLTLSTPFQSNVASQNVQITASPSILSWTATSNVAWLSAAPASGITPATLQLSFATSGLNPGTYSGTINVVSLGSSTTSTPVNVNLTVTQTPPVMVTSPSSLSFTAIQGQPVAAQALSVTNSSPGSFNWSASSDSSWLMVSPASGATPQNLGVSVSSSGLADGTYTGHITVSAAGVSNAPQVIPVTMQVLTQELAENFSNNALGWIISPMGNANGWSTANGVYTYSGLGLSQSCAGNAGWTDYMFSTDIQLANLNNWPGGVRGRVNPSTGAGYAVWLYPGTGKMILYRAPSWSVNDPGLTALASANVAYSTGNAHHLAMTFQGSTISVSWDGVNVISATDATYASGNVCMDADNQPISYSNVLVAGLQNAVTATASPSTFSFSGAVGTALPSQTLAIAAGGASTTFAVTSSASWLTATSASSTTPANVSLNVNTSGLAEGTYSGTITIVVPGATNSPLTVPVSLQLTSNGIVAATPASLTFFGAVGLNPTPQTVQISNAGTGTLNWTASTTNTWLGLSATSGTAPSTLTVSPNASATGNGTFNDSIVIQGGTSSASVAASMQVGNLLFNDDFSAGAGNWTISPLGDAAGWSVVNGAYTFDGSQHTQSYAGNPTWTNYTVATDFQLSSASDYPGGLRGRVNTTTGASYGAWIYPAEGVIKLFRIGQWNIDADLSVLGQSAPLNINTNWHNLRMVFQGTSIKVYFDNVLAISATDASYSQGAVALDVSNQPIKFDNVSVISLP